VRLAVGVRRIQRRTRQAAAQTSSHVHGVAACVAVEPLVFSATDVVTTSQERAAVAPSELFRRFSWNPTLDIVHGIQGQLQ
jgi:uncharacterized membrane protein